MSFFNDVVQRGWLPSGTQPNARWNASRPRMSNERRTKLFFCYLPDWVLTLVLAGLLAIINKAHGFRREFSLTDTSLQHTYALHERVPVWLLAVCALVIPVLLIALTSLVFYRSFWDCHAALLGLILAHALTITATTIIKVTVGRPRPDVIDRCHPTPGATNGSPYGLVTDLVCTTSPESSILTDGFRSFPSGHASTAFAGLTFLSLYLAGKVHLYDKRGHAASAWLVFFPMMGAALIAISRTMDYRHHATDVLAGGILGAIVAVVIYHLYYPPLWDTRCHKPWAPRIAKTDADPADIEAEGLAAAHAYAHGDSSGGPRSEGPISPADTHAGPGYLDRHSHDLHA